MTVELQESPVQCSTKGLRGQGDRKDIEIWIASVKSVSHSTAAALLLIDQNL
jgi:hypothetical protein